jgi:hypothetical protein
MAFRNPVPAKGKVRGVYEIKFEKVQHPDKHTDWFYRLTKEKPKGEVEWCSQPEQPDAWQNAFNFTPETSDANIGGRCSALVDGHAKGVWDYSLFAGGFEGGVLELRRK